MASKARSKSTNKKPTARRAKAHDRRLLAKAERETEAKAPGPQVATISVKELQSVCLQLKDLTHEIVECWAARDTVLDGLESVLTALHTARLNLEGAAQVSP